VQRRYSKAAAAGIRATPQTHAELERAALQLLNLQPYAYAFPTHGTRNHPETDGVADIIACLFGYFVAIEIKVGKDKASEGQRIFCGYVRHAHGDYVIIRTIEELQELLEAPRENR
jgi:hypothetical protein